MMTLKDRAPKWKNTKEMSGFLNFGWNVHCIPYTLRIINNVFLNVGALSSLFYGYPCYVNGTNIKYVCNLAIDLLLLGL